MMMRRIGGVEVMFTFTLYYTLRKGERFDKSTAVLHVIIPKVRTGI
jgi:hypothetical protein